MFGWCSSIFANVDLGKDLYSVSKCLFKVAIKAPVEIIVVSLLLILNRFFS